MKTASGRRAARRRRSPGFTLVEVLVALFIMAILAGLAWQGLDSIMRARDSGRGAIDRTVRLATVLTQWEQDLQSIYDTTAVPPLSFDGQTLRLTRRTAGGVVVVAWAVRGGLWQRWAGPAHVRVGDLQQAWLQSQQLVGNEAGQVTLAEDASQWQVYFSRGGLWSNPQSTGNFAQVVAPVVAVAAAPASAASAGAAASAAGTAAAAPQAAAVLRETMPDAVRIVVTLGGQVLTRDIALGATGS